MAPSCVGTPTLPYGRQKGAALRRPSMLWLGRQVASPVTPSLSLIKDSDRFDIFDAGGACVNWPVPWPADQVLNRSSSRSDLSFMSITCPQKESPEFCQHVARRINGSATAVVVLRRWLFADHKHHRGVPRSILLRDHLDQLVWELLSQSSIIGLNRRKNGVPIYEYHYVVL